MAHQEPPKEEELRENSSNLRAHLAKGDWARLFQASQGNQKRPESTDQLPETLRSLPNRAEYRKDLPPYPLIYHPLPRLA